ncbi:hypothetical protein SY27_03450 [Flavobacterium sp. 316]|uniref:carboxypeptidase-like regulatory domain-containing protein n=1 Tax=Flavobacterium sp. 316 TaxID=1603293 RepID=UPI0005E9B249|nr:carboxypeptidase-like regulatory domain-containing protein [Flavobacterium sp. 316]KIX22879.1 hypothetical protein SY27_03450 [Flavobacterium sp. 316]
MKIFLFFFILFNSPIIAQIVVEGKVTDEDNMPIYGASVYVNGTTIGTMTDSKGDFILHIPSELNTEIITSYIGYKTTYSVIQKNSFKLNIVLKQNVTELKEVVLSQNKFSRKQMLDIFRKNFLGTTKAGKNAIITNEDEIYFDYNNDNFVLTAFSDKPLLIDNPYLGYKIEYTLLEFSTTFYKSSININDAISSSFGGYSVFKETELSSKISKRREKAYKGSFLHLFRNLAQEKWSKDEFLLFEGSFMVNSKEHFKIEKDSSKNMSEVFVEKQDRSLRKKGFIAEFSILYDQKEQSKIFFYTSKFSIDIFGLFTDYDKIYFSGDITKRKVGDLLPSNYGL